MPNRRLRARRTEQDYVQQIGLNPTAKKLVVTATNSDYKAQ